MFNNIIKIATLFVVFVVILGSFVSTADAAKKVEVYHITARLIADPEVTVDESSSLTIIKTKCIVDDKEVLIVEKIMTYSTQGSGVWINGFRVVGAHQRVIGEHHFKVIDTNSGQIIYASGWTVDQKGKIKSMNRSIPEVTYVDESENN